MSEDGKESGRRLRVGVFVLIGMVAYFRRRKWL